jgi:SnoaL-like domain
MSEKDDVLAANVGFYRAFAAGDMAAMDALWSPRGEVTCIHPGWQALVERDAVMQSWQAILASPPAVRCLGARAFVENDRAYVICYETVGDGMLVATNIFSCEEGTWRMVHHQAGPTRALQEVQPDNSNRVH